MTNQIAEFSQEAESEVVLRWNGKSLQQPSSDDIDRAISSVSGTDVPVTSLESHGVSIESRLGRSTGLLAWVPVQDLPRVSDRRDLTREEIVAVFSSFRGGDEPPPIPGGWREVFWSGEENAPEFQALRRSQEVKVQRLKGQRETFTADKHYWLVRATAAHVAARGMTTLLGGGLEGEAHEDKEMATYDLELFVHRMFKEELSKSL